MQLPSPYTATVVQCRAGEPRIFFSSFVYLPVASFCILQHQRVNFMGRLTSTEIIRNALTISKVRSKTTPAIAAGVYFSEASVSGWRCGRLIPDPDQSERLAKFLFPRDSENQHWMIEKLRESREPERPNVLNGLHQQSIALRIGSASKASYGRPGFLDQFVARFMRIAGIGHQFIKTDDLVDLIDLVQSDVDVGLGIFATLDRSLLIKFFSTPIRVGLNAIATDIGLQRASLTIQTVRKLLAPEELGKSPQPDSRITPVVIRSDVGGIYTTKTLGYTEEGCEFPGGHHYREYGKTIIKLESRYGTHQLSKLPIAIVDDVTAIYIMRYLQRNNVRARLVFPVGTERSAGQERKWLPEYLVSISVKRTNTELVDYLRDALRLFLRTEIQMISSFYHDVCCQFETLATAVGVGTLSWTNDDKSRSAYQDQDEENRAAAKAWVEYTFGITENQIRLRQDFDLPWKVILEMSRSLWLATHDRPQIHAKGESRDAELSPKPLGSNETDG